MISSSSFNKSRLNPDSYSPGRNTGDASNRVSPGITPLGEENQQVRIQLPVYRHNGIASGPFNSRSSLVSPVKHSLLKNSLKVRNYEADTEGMPKVEKRNENQYEGVGAFPTIHLKKSAVRYRPIKRFHDVKIPHPELPVNRFLSHLPEVCPDLKPSTRSVLDVLEDLSGNKIHSKEENGSNKPKLRGLGGGYHLNPTTVYKPLFVQKPKSSAVLTRDSTTQTLFPISVEEKSSPQCSSSSVKNGAYDLRVELRRKLAKQNNEIFASLSSSISSNFTLKRKIDKILPSKNDGLLNNGSTQKRPKTLDDRPHGYNGNGVAKSGRTSSSELGKLSRKCKPGETNSASPNKDRLTTIFLDTRNISPKAQVFQPNTSTETKTIEKANNDVVDTTGKTKSLPANSSCVENSKDGSGQNFISCNALVKSASCSSDSKGTEESNKADTNGFVNGKDTSLKSNVNSTSSLFCFGTNAEGTSKNTVKESNLEENSNNSNAVNKSFTFGNSSDKPNFGSFKFGINDNSPLTQNKSSTDFKSITSKDNSVSSSISTSPAAQFSFSATSSVTLSPLQTSAAQSGVTSGQNTFIAPGKTTFTFGQAFHSQENAKGASTEAKSQTSDALPIVTSAATANSTAKTPETVQSVPFTFGQKPTPNTAPDEEKVKVMSPNNNINQSTSAVPFAAGLNKNSSNLTLSSGTSFSFGQKLETSVAPAVQTSAAQNQMKTFPFSFGQKSDVGASETQVELGKSSEKFLFEQKPISRASTESNVVSAYATAPSQTGTTQMSQTFVQAVSPVMVTSQSSSQTSTTFGTKFAGDLSVSKPTSELSQTDAAFGSGKPLSFGSINGFGKTAVQTATGLTTSTSNTSVFTFGVSTTSQSIPTFDVSRATPTFKAPSSSLSLSSFGSTTTSQTAPSFETTTSCSAPSGFTIPTTKQSSPIFGVSSAPQSTSSFDLSAAKSTPSSFGTITTQVTPTFKLSSQPAPAFGTSSITQVAPTFATTAGFGLPTSQPSTLFAPPTSTQSALLFGAPQTTQVNTTFGAPSSISTAASTQPSSFGSPATTSTPVFSTSQTFDNKPVASITQTPSIFAQNTVPAFSSAATFSPSPNNIFAQKPSMETPLFSQRKTESSGFDSSQPFGAQGKFSFGMPATSVTAFTTSSAMTTASSVFSFGSSSSGNAFTFGSSAIGSSNTQTPFAFKSPSNEPFKFGATMTTATTTTTTPQPVPAATFSFGSQMNSNPVAEQKAPFGFGNSEPAAPAPFSFGSTPTPSSSVFNFGGSTPSTNTFNFGTSTPGVPFAQTPLPGTQFAVPGTFNIGSGSSQSRPRASSRPRRRP